MSEIHLNQSGRVACSSMLQNKHAKILRDTTWKSVKTGPRQLKLSGKQVQGMPGHELNQSWHVACSSGYKINMPRHVGNSSESIRTCSLQYMFHNKHAKIFRDTTWISQDSSPAVEIGWKTSARHAGVLAESILTCRLQFMLQNKHAKILRDTTWKSVKTVPLELKLSGKQVQGMPGHELGQSWHVACSSGYKINMPRHVGNSPESIRTCSLQFHVAK